MYSNRLQRAPQNLLQCVVRFFHPRSSCTTTHISADVQRITKQLDSAASLALWVIFSLSRCGTYSVLSWSPSIRLQPFGLCASEADERHGKPPTDNQELLVVRDKVGRPPGDLGVSKSMECDIFHSVLWHCWLGDRKGIRPVKETGCWFVGGDDLTGALYDL